MWQPYHVKGKKLWKVAAGVLIAMSVFGTVWTLWPAAEPIYNGKPLSYWLEDLGMFRYSTRPDPRSTNAVQQIGTNAIPTLLRMVKARDSSLTDKLNTAINHLPWVKFRFQTAGWKQHLALTGFKVLGPLGRNTVPELLRIYMRYPRDESQRQWIVSIVSNMTGEEERAVPFFALDVLSDPDLFLPIVGAQELENIACHPEGSIPAIIKVLGCSSPILRGYAAQFLGSYQEQAEIVIPALVTSLGDADLYVRLSATKSLGTFGPAARSALPILQQMLVNPGSPNAAANWDNHFFVTQAIKRISPSNSELCDFAY